MRYAPSQRLLRLALALAGARTGLSLDEMAQALGVGRRTAERLRDSLEEIFPQIECHDDEERVRRWRLPGGAIAGIVEPRPEVVAAIDGAARAAEMGGDADRASLLREGGATLRAVMRPAALRRAEPDIAALMEAEGVAMRPGPRPVLSPHLLPTLRRAILGVQLLVLRYEASGQEPATRIVCPYGILYGGRGWLVAHVEGTPEMRLWRLDRIVSADLMDRGFARDPEFSLAGYAAQSFGVWQGDTQDVVLRFRPEAVEAAEGWVFHPSQRVERKTDGSLLVSFSAAGMRELCWHLFTWGQGVEIVSPASLQAEMTACLRACLTELC